MVLHSDLQCRTGIAEGLDGHTREKTHREGVHVRPLTGCPGAERVSFRLRRGSHPSQWADNIILSPRFTDWEDYWTHSSRPTDDFVESIRNRHENEWPLEERRVFD